MFNICWHAAIKGKKPSVILKGENIDKVYTFFLKKSVLEKFLF